MGPLLFAPAILVVTGFTAAEFGVGMATASFCKDVDVNALTYIKRYADNTTYEVSQYYINGTGLNPFLDDLQTAQAKLNEISALFDAFGPIIGQECNSPVAVDTLEKSLIATNAPILTVDQLLDAKNIYPYYKTAVHDNACKTLISGVAWLVVFQLVVGLLCLPCLTTMADSFFARWTFWHSSPAARGLIFQELSV